MLAHALAGLACCTATVVLVWALVERVRGIAAARPAGRHRASRTGREATQ